MSSSTLPGVEVWVAAPDQAPRELVDHWLSDEDRARADRITIDTVAHGLRVSRALLRMAAAAHGCDLTWTRAGRPLCSGPLEGALSASRTRGLVAVARTAQGVVGVDVEHVRPGPAEGPLPGAVLAPLELEHLAALPESTRRRAFFRLWTRKEAVWKAAGDAPELTSLDVSWRSPTWSLALPGGAITVQDLGVGAQHLAAVAWNGRGAASVHVDAWGQWAARLPATGTVWSGAGSRG